MQLAQFCSAQEYVGAKVSTWKEGKMEFGGDFGESSSDCRGQVLIEDGHGILSFLNSIHHLASKPDHRSTTRHLTFLHLLESYNLQSHSKKTTEEKISWRPGHWSYFFNAESTEMILVKGNVVATGGASHLLETRDSQPAVRIARVIFAGDSDETEVQESTRLPDNHVARVGYCSETFKKMHRQLSLCLEAPGPGSLG
uniref:Uncharacterized protein n=1 Tax=Molossus molossus TaxID=27622 RepID=A0A7J8EF08_MOLMO|nr:hypothetical protein HJG59_008829 [Molossus molossus]